MASTRAPSSSGDHALAPLQVTDRRRGRDLASSAPAHSPWAGRSMQLISVLAISGGLLGLVNLFLPGVLRPGVSTVVYAATMLTLVVGGLVLFAGGERAAWLVPIFVLAGDLVYVVVALCVVDSALYATPMMLLFSTLCAGALLGPRLLGVHCAVVVPSIAVGLSGAYADPTALVVQVVVHAGVLDLTALAIFVLRRRSERLLEQTRMLSTIDPLTALPNRRHVAERAGALLADARRSGQSVAALLIDIDHFKVVNDTYGHATGDEVLCATADSVRGVLREGDVASRIGGEEMLVLAQVPGRSDAYRMAERLHEAVRDAESPVHTTCSIGVAVASPTGGADAVEWVWQLVAVADAAMYRAKELGRDRWVMAPADPLPETVDSPPEDLLDATR